MDEHTTNERFTEYTVFSVLIAFLLFLFGLFVGLSISKEADFSFQGIIWLFKHDPLIWILALFTLLAPLGVYFLTRNFHSRLSKKQEIIHNEQSRIDQVNEFTQQLIHDNFEIDFAMNGENDVLGETLLNLRNTLKNNKDNNEKLRKDEEQRNWIAEGSAHFSETLRNYIHEPDLLAFHVIKDLTKYVNAIQGGFYILDDNDTYNRFFALTAFFAYDRRKFADQKIKWGDGLVGTCAMEKKTIHLKNIPDEYITVTSGLGEANPDNLIVVPMLYEDQIYGVFEIASFNKFEPRHVSLIEKTAESVGATLSAIKTNLRTARLLEESKAQTQTLTSHEEEMRQNMEELQATQEESIRQTQRLFMLEQTLKQNIIQAEFDANGSLISANDLFFNKFEFSLDLRLEGKNFIEFIDEEFRKLFEMAWKNLIEDNKPFKGYLKYVTRTGKDLWALSSVSTILDEDQSVSKVILLAIDSSEEHTELKKLETILQSLNNTSVHLEFDINGNLLKCNEKFTDLFGLSQKEIKSTVIFDLIHPNDLEEFNKRWDGIIHGNAYSGIFRGKTSGGQEVWLNGAFNITLNAAHETEHVIFVGVDITHEKKIESELHASLDTLKKQEKQIKEAEKETTSKIRETKNELLTQLKEVEKSKNLTEKLLEHASDAIITTSNDNRIIFFNKAAEQLWQYDRNEVLNQDIGILFPEILTEKDELLASFTLPGDHKMTGKRKKTIIIDKKGKEKPVYVLLSKAKVDNENAYMALIQPA